MSAVSATSTPAQRLLNDVLGPSARSDAGRESRLPVAGASDKSDAPVGKETGAASDTESTAVTLSQRGSDSRPEPELPRVYAEVWRDGVKIALVDANGGVRGLAGLVASQIGSGGPGGMLLAARRATEVAAAVGGEIRVGGQTLDRATLQTRARLAATYGV